MHFLTTSFPTSGIFYCRGSPTPRFKTRGRWLDTVHIIISVIKSTLGFRSPWSLLSTSTKTISSSLETYCLLNVIGNVLETDYWSGSFQYFELESQRSLAERAVLDRYNVVT